MSITETAVHNALRQVIDPELGINIVDLGLVYRVEIDGTRVRVVMTMTSPACPLVEYLKDLVHSAVTSCVPGAEDVETIVVWEPSWNPDMMSAEARRQFDGGTS